MRKYAFTLIEILVVIAIISTLAAILFPVFAQAKGQAKQAACVNNLKQLSLGVALYMNDNDDTFPMGGWQYPNEVAPTALSRWYSDIAPYTSSFGIRHCPQSPYPFVEAHTDYGINPSIAAWETAESASKLLSPASLVLMTDTAQLNFTQLPTSSDAQNPATWANWIVGPTDFQVEGPYVFFPSIDFPYADTPDRFGDQFRRPIPIHQGRVNVAFCEGHAKSMDIRALIGPMPCGFPLTDPRNLWSNAY